MRGAGGAGDALGGAVAYGAGAAYGVAGVGVRAPQPLTAYDATVSLGGRRMSPHTRHGAPKAVAGQRFPFLPVPAAQPLPSAGHRKVTRPNPKPNPNPTPSLTPTPTPTLTKVTRRKLKSEMTPSETVEQAAGVAREALTPRGETKLLANVIKARLAYFQQFEEVMEAELQC